MLYQMIRNLAMVTTKHRQHVGTVSASVKWPKIVYSFCCKLNRADCTLAHEKYILYHILVKRGIKGWEVAARTRHFIIGGVSDSCGGKLIGSKALYMILVPSPSCKISLTNSQYSASERPAKILPILNFFEAFVPITNGECQVDWDTVKLFIQVQRQSKTRNL